MAGLYDRDQFVLHKTTLDEAPDAGGRRGDLRARRSRASRRSSSPAVRTRCCCGGCSSVALVVARAAARFVDGPDHRDRARAGGRRRARRPRWSSASSPRDPSLNAEVVGRVSVESAPRRAPRQAARDASTSCRRCSSEHRVERVIVAPTHEGGEDVVDMVRLATACGVRVAVLPRLLEVIGTSVEFDDLGGQVLLGVRGFGLSPSSRVLKRVVRPRRHGRCCWSCWRRCCWLIAIAVKLTSPGPVLFRQTRVGRARARVPGAEVPHDGRRRRRAQAGAARAQRGRAAVQDRRRPAHHAGWAASCGAARSTSFRSSSTCCAAT